MSLSEAMEKAREQFRLTDPIEARGLYGLRCDQIEEFCMILAEVYMMPPDYPIRVGGDTVDAFMVGEIFSMLTEEHALLVLQKYGQVRDIIRNKKLYLRTCLYNTAFELANHYANEAAAGTHGGRG